MTRIAWGLVFTRDSRYKHILRDLLQALWRGTSKRPGYVIAGALAVIYGWVAFHGPQGIQALLQKHQEIRALQEQNAGIALENQRRKDRIKRLEESRSEQEMEIRKQLKMLRPGETTFILPDGTDPAHPGSPQPSADPPAAR